MGNYSLAGSVLAAVLLIVAGFGLVLGQQDVDAAVIGLPEESEAVDCPGTELYIGWGELESLSLAEAEHEIGVLAIIPSQEGSSKVTLRIDGEITEGLAVGRNVRLADGATLTFLGIHEDSGEARLCAINSE